MRHLSWTALSWQKPELWRSCRSQHRWKIMWRKQHWKCWIILSVAEILPAVAQRPARRDWCTADLVDSTREMQAMLLMEMTVPLHGLMQVLLQMDTLGWISEQLINLAKSASCREELRQMEIFSRRVSWSIPWIMKTGHRLMVLTEQTRSTWIWQTSPWKLATSVCVHRLQQANGMQSVNSRQRLSRQMSMHTPTQKLTKRQL